jgi:hypothetical protein
MGGNCIFDVGDIEVVILYLTFLDKVISYSRDVVAMVDVCQMENLGKALLSEGIHDDSVSVFRGSGNIFYQGAEVEEVVMSFRFTSGHFLLIFSDSTNDKHFRDASVEKHIWWVGYLNFANTQNCSRIL